QVLDGWRAGRFTLATSDHILTELSKTFAEPWFRSRLTPIEIAEDLELLRRNAVVVPITAEVHGVATHPEDDLVLATAISARADYLVTGDRQLQRLGSYQGVIILSPRAFLEQVL